MKNEKLIEMTKEITIAMISSSSQYYPDEDRAQDLANAMDIIYNKLVDLAKQNDLNYTESEN